MSTSIATGRETVDVSTQPLGQRIADRSLHLLRLHATPAERAGWDDQPLTGGFSLLRGREEADLYGMIDAVYILHTLGELAGRTDRDSRRAWADAILACQDDEGRFTRRNLRGHRHEHATAYAVGALCLLEHEADESHLERLKPMRDLRPLLNDRRKAERWIRRMGFERWSDILRKDVGWHHVWRGSHIGGGVAATVGMAATLLDGWWRVDATEWLHWYLDWLDAHVNEATGFWQRAIWNLVYRKPTIIDLGGAAHFAWIYHRCNRPLPYPERMIESTLSLQRESGLYREKPFCLDLDANFCIIRPLQQFDTPPRDLLARAERAVQRSFDATSRFLAEEDLPTAYGDSHGLPGALISLVECTKLPGFQPPPGFERWQHVLDRAWWL